MDYFILTNNKTTRELVEKNSHITLVFLEETVQGLLHYCQTLFEEGGYGLAADPMGGRRARPFPFLTLILEKTGKETSQRDWERIMQYSLLDQKRKDKYQHYDEGMKEDFRVLDCSLTRAALKL